MIKIRADRTSTKPEGQCCTSTEKAKAHPLNWDSFREGAEGTRHKRRPPSGVTSQDPCRLVAGQSLASIH